MTGAHRHRGQSWGFLRDGAYRVALGLGPLCWMLLALAGWAHAPGSLHPDTGRWTPAVHLHVFLLGVLVAPVLEELVFRGGLQRWLRGWPRLAVGMHGLTGANLLASLVFCAVHLLNHPPAAAALVYLPSLVFGWAYDRYGRVLPGMLLHAFYNAGFLLFIA